MSTFVNFAVKTRTQNNVIAKKVRENSRECHNHKPQPFPDPKRKRKPRNLNKHKPNKRTKSTKISSLFPKRGNRNTKRTEKYKNKMTRGKTYNKSPRRINHKATKSKTNTGTTALERLVEQTTKGFKALLQLYLAKVLSTLVISKSRGLSEILRYIRTSTYQICRMEEKINRTTSFHI